LLLAAILVLGVTILVPQKYKQGKNLPATGAKTSRTTPKAIDFYQSLFYLIYIIL
jgi:hypothetical protein